MLSALRQFPMLQHLLRPGSEGKLTVPVLLHLLKARFSGCLVLFLKDTSIELENDFKFTNLIIINTTTIIMNQ